MAEFIIALILVSVSHALRVRFGLNLADEGFLWNGALRIGQGKIPIRDYKSYDPGRFYWSWAAMQLFGTGLLGLRHSVAAFQVLGLWAGLTAVSTQTDNVFALALAGTVFVIWMLPRHKIFDHSMALIAVATVTMLLQAPSPVTALLAGIMTGIAGVMGRNHGAYAFAATALALLLVWAKGYTDSAIALTAIWGLGIIVGYSPMLGMFVFIPDMFRRYVHDKVLVFFRRGGIDISRPVPWPWTQRYAGLTRLNAVSRFLTGMHFVVLPVFYAVALLWVVLDPDGLRNGYLAASCLVGIFYLHHAASRSDIPHLCQVMLPFVSGLLALAYGAENALVYWLTPLALIAIGWLVVRQIDARLQWMEYPDLFAEIDILGERFIALRGVAATVTSVRARVTKELGPEDRLFIAPMAAMLYPVLQKETPVRSDFLHFPETDPVQDVLIADLEKTGTNWALIESVGLDRQDSLSFRNTHARVWRYLEDNFTCLQTPDLGSRWSLWRRDQEDADHDQNQMDATMQSDTTRMREASR